MAPRPCASRTRARSATSARSTSPKAWSARSWCISAARRRGARGRELDRVRRRRCPPRVGRRRAGRTCAPRRPRRGSARCGTVGAFAHQSSPSPRPRPSRLIEPVAVVGHDHGEQPLLRQRDRHVDLAATLLVGVLDDVGGGFETARRTRSTTSSELASEAAISAISSLICPIAPSSPDTTFADPRAHPVQLGSRLRGAKPVPGDRASRGGGARAPRRPMPAACAAGGSPAVMGAGCGGIRRI